MSNKATSQASLQCITTRVKLVVQLFMSLPKVLPATKYISVLSTFKALLDFSFLGTFSRCLPSIYLYNQQQSKLSCFVII
jgi:hypothetical protein